MHPNLAGITFLILRNSQDVVWGRKDVQTCYHFLPIEFGTSIYTHNFSCDGPGYTCIFDSGGQTCVLHHTPIAALKSVWCRAEQVPKQRWTLARSNPQNLFCSVPCSKFSNACNSNPLLSQLPSSWAATKSSKNDHPQKHSQKF